MFPLFRALKRSVRCPKKCQTLLLFVALCVVAVLWFTIENSENDSDYISDHVKLRLKNDQNEYIDGKGVRVVVGRYTGDETNLLDLTKDVLDANFFDPKPSEGKNGQPVVISAHYANKMRQLFRINRFNLMASDRIPLNRTLPDVRKKGCLNKSYNLTTVKSSVSVIIVFHNEAWSTLLRTVTSVINRSSPDVLKEIILVDDASTRSFLKQPLNDFVSKLSRNVRVIHAWERKGLIKSRLLGAAAATGNILVFLDAHCECTEGWLEPLVDRVTGNRKTVACPIIDIIKDDTLAYVKSFERHFGAFNWDLHFRWYTSSQRQAKKDFTQPFHTPTMAGGLFAIDKEYFYEIGSYDDKMEIWGGENLELSFRVWQCGGSVEIVPCSHVGHIFRKSSPYTFPGGVSSILYANLARVAAVWMDEWAKFYFKFHPEAVPITDQDSIRSRLDLRKRLNCKSFEWYLKNVWPENFMPMAGRFFGKIKHRSSGLCLEKPIRKRRINQPSGSAELFNCSSQEDLTQSFVLIYESGKIAADESVCLDISSQARPPTLHILPCTGSDRQKWHYDKKTEALKHVSSDLCVQLFQQKRLILKDCNLSPLQAWIFESVPWK